MCADNWHELRTVTLESETADLKQIPTNCCYYDSGRIWHGNCSPSSLNDVIRFN